MQHAAKNNIKRDTGKDNHTKANNTNQKLNTTHSYLYKYSRWEPHEHHGFVLNVCTVMCRCGSQHHKVFVLQAPQREISFNISFDWWFAQPGCPGIGTSLPTYVGPRCLGGTALDPAKGGRAWPVGEGLRSCRFKEDISTKTLCSCSSGEGDWHEAHRFTCDGSAWQSTLAICFARGMQWLRMTWWSKRSLLLLVLRKTILQEIGSESTLVVVENIWSICNMNLFCRARRCHRCERLPELQ